MTDRQTDRHYAKILQGLEKHNSVSVKLAMTKWNFLSSYNKLSVFLYMMCKPNIKEVITLRQNTHKKNTTHMLNKSRTRESDAEIFP